MHRRTFLTTSGRVVTGLAISGCLPRTGARLAPTARRRVDLVPVDVSWERIIRTTVGLRPHRDSGFVVRADRLDDKTVIHNYGHGGAGYSLSWGTGALVADLALAHTERRAAVIGCGIVGLTAARQLQRRGFDVTIFAASLPPETTSNMAWAAFTPVSGLVSAERRTPEWDDQFRRAVEIAYRQHQLLAGPRYGVSWIDDYSPIADPNAPRRRSAVSGDESGPGLLGPATTFGRIMLGPGDHPFDTPYASRAPSLRFEPSIYLDALMRDVIEFGGHIVVRAFDTPRDLMSLSESLVVNCTGLGAKTLFGDEELVPVKGQLTVLVPQVDVIYSAGGMMPRSDGIVLGHVSQRGVWSLDVDEAERKRVVDGAIAFFARMRPAPGAATRASAQPESAAAISPPPVESFFDRQS
jgi:glycine/D-amino acid oxidase-like deaminating enzyme